MDVCIKGVPLEKLRVHLAVGVEVQEGPQQTSVKVHMRTNYQHHLQRCQNYEQDVHERSLWEIIYLPRSAEAWEWLRSSAAIIFRFLLSRLIDEFVIESLLAYQTVPHIYVISIDRVNQSIDRVMIELISCLMSNCLELI